jgi:hypothetical protein
MFRVIHAGRSMLCVAAKTHKRGIAHRMEIIERAQREEKIYRT